MNSDSLSLGWGEELTLFANTSSESDLCGPYATLRKEAY